MNNVNTFAAIFKCNIVLTITHDEDENFRFYERKQYHAIRWDYNAQEIKMESCHDDFVNYRLPDFDEEEEVDEWNRYGDTLDRARDCFKDFADSLTPEEWEATAAAALESPDEEVPMNFNSPSIPGFKITASMLISSANAYELTHDEEIAAMEARGASAAEVAQVVARPPWGIADVLALLARQRK